MVTLGLALASCATSNLSTTSVPVTVKANGGGYSVTGYVSATLQSPIAPTELINISTPTGALRLTPDAPSQPLDFSVNSILTNPTPTDIIVVLEPHDVHDSLAVAKPIDAMAAPSAR